MHHVRVYRRRENGDLELAAEFQSIGEREVSFLHGQLALLSGFVTEVDGELLPRNVGGFTYQAVRSLLERLVKSHDRPDR